MIAVGVVMAGASWARARGERAMFNVTPLPPR